MTVFHLNIIFLSVFSSTGLLVLVLLLLLCSALLSSSEVALFSLSPSQKADLAESKSSSDQRILELLELPDRELGPKRLLATVLIANNAINIAIVLLATQLSDEWFPQDGFLKTLIDVVVITFILVLFAEVVPKVYATGNNLQVARMMALPLKAISKILSPLTWFLMGTSSMLEKALKNKVKTNISVDELGHALELTADDDRTDEEHKILEGIVTFGGKEAAQIMTARVDISFLRYTDSFQEVLETVLDKGYSRLPVIKDSPDEVAGFLFVKDLLPYLDEVDYAWQDLIKQPFFVPENKKIDDLLQEFQQAKIHLAIVVDEYGGTSGLVTLEDILEEIVGEISDEFDEEELQYSKLDERTYVMEGKISLVDMYKIMGIEPEDFEEARGDSSSLAGFLIEQAGRIPLRGDAIQFKGYHFLIESADKRKIKRVKISLPEKISSENH
ncbi:MAG: gliding motility-associated protein GldE [Flavobacteriales bacterium]|nr:gliding motility-associated protein GldE [Flavobacteriales bacterium]